MWRVLKPILIVVALTAVSLSQGFFASGLPRMTEAFSSDDANLFLMIYMSADTTGSPLDWTGDLNEMENGLINNNITVLALVDPEGIGDSRVYLVRRDISGSEQIISTKLENPPFLPSDNEANMGDPDTLSGFVRYSLANYYNGGTIGLVIWGHGAGWAGVAIDKSDYLTRAELATALEEIDNTISRPIDLIIFDACSMGSIEFLSGLSGLVSLAVASEMEIPASGFPYDTILRRISLNLPMPPSEIAFSFADEYVKLSALITESSAQASVIDLSALPEAQERIASLSRTCILFDPLLRDLFNDTRDLSAAIQATGSIDVIDYLSRLCEHDDVPRKLLRPAIAAKEALSLSVLRNRVFVSASDLSIIRPESLSGLTIYYPDVPVSLTAYRETSSLAELWGEFLKRVMSAHPGAPPVTGLSLLTRDLRFDDGLNDSFEFEWEETPEVVSWEFEFCLSGSIDPALERSANDTDMQILVDALEAGFYDVFAYGLDGNGEYVFFEGFLGQAVSRFIDITARVPTTIDIRDTQLRITNLGSGEVTYVSVSQYDIPLSFAVPTPNAIGDIILVELCRNDTVLARGVLILDTGTFEMRLFSEPTVSPISLFVLTMILAFLSAFSVLHFLRIRHERKSRSGR